MKYLSILWQAPQWIVGYMIYTVANSFNLIVNYERAESIHLIALKNVPGGLSLGKWIFGPGNIKANYKDHLLVHEYGHSIQSRIYGPFYLPLIGIPSLFSAILTSSYLINTQHKRRWYEIDASRRGKRAFEERGLDIESYSTGCGSKYINPRTGQANFTAYLPSIKYGIFEFSADFIIYFWTYGIPATLVLLFD